MHMKRATGRDNSRERAVFVRLCGRLSEDAAPTEGATRATRAHAVRDMVAIAVTLQLHTQLATPRCTHDPDLSRP
jgi:hypothetical protein